MSERMRARSNWQALSEAQFDRPTLLWLANVAGQLIKADAITGDDNLRRAAIVRAVGLEGRLDFDSEVLRSVVADVDHTCDLIQKGSRFSPGRPLARGERAHLRREAVAQRLGLEESDAAIDKRIRRALGK